MKKPIKALLLLLSGAISGLGVYMLGLPIHNNFLNELHFTYGLPLLIIGFIVFMYNYEKLESQESDI